MSNKRRWLKKLLAVSLSAAVISGVGAAAPLGISGGVLAVSATETAGTEIPDGYTPLYTIDDLYNIRSNPYGKYILMNDIDLSATAPGGEWDCGTGWSPIPTFSGTLDGNGHTISNMNIYGDVQYAGFIGQGYPTIKNLHFEDVDINIDRNGEGYCGVICAYVSGNVTNIRSCSVKGGTINYLVHRNSFIGGLVGLCYINNGYGPLVEQCYSAVSINVNDVQRHIVCYAGGIIGGTRGERASNGYTYCKMIDCYNNSIITSNGTAGGLLGLYKPFIIINNCCNLKDGKIYGVCVDSGYSHDIVKNEIKLCFIPSDSTFGQGGTELTPYLMTKPASFTNFDFNNVWEIAPDGSRPQLKNNPEITVTDIEMGQLPSEYDYYQGDEIVADGTVKVNCSNGNSAEVSITKDMLSGYDMSKLGEQQVKVSYKGKDCYFNIFVHPILAEGITLNNTEVAVNKGDAYTLKATVKPDNTTDKTVTWKSLQPSVATVDDKGHVTAVNKGTATIKASTANGKTAVCTVHVKIPAKAIALEAQDMHMGQTQTLTPQITPADSTCTLSWSSSDNSVATVNNKGVVTAVAPGQTRIRVGTNDGPYASCLINVDAPANSVTVTPTAKTIYVGDSFTVNAVIDPDNTTDDITCRSVNGKIASAEPVYKNVQVYNSKTNKYETVRRFAGCKVTGLSRGKTTIVTESGNGKKATCAVTVKQHINSISLNRTDLSMEIGSTIKLYGNISPETNDDTTSWSSSKPGVVTVDKNGNINAVGIGTATVKLSSSNGKSAACKVTVKKTATDIALSASDITIEKGSTKTVKATLSPKDTTDKVTWTSSDPNVASVSGGIITAVSSGKAKITATTTGGLSAVVNVTVKVSAQGVELDNETLKLKKGNTASLNAYVEPYDTTNKTIKWLTSNSKVAKVKNGIVTAVGVGSATITAKTVNGKTATCTVSVYVDPDKIKLGITSATIINGKTKKLDAKIYPTAAENKSITWTSSNTSVAVVSSEGVVTAKGSGTATITAQTYNGVTATCKVKVVTKPSDISLNKSSITVYKGKTVALTATVLPTTADNKTVTWKSSNRTIATVENGIVTGIKPGTVTVTAKTVNGLTARCTVTVVAVPTKIKLSSTSATIINGNSKTLKATVYPSAAENKSVTWTSSNTSVASVNSAGVVTAKSSGITTITAKTFNGLTASCQVKVVTKPSGISLNKSSLTVEQGKTASLTATVSPSTADNKTVTWKSSNANVASVSNGVVKGIGVGTATVTATTVNGLKASCTITVKAPVVLPTSIALDRSAFSLTVGSTSILDATVYPANAANKSVTWTSSNTSVATVSAGKVTAKSAGTAVITAKTFNGKTATCKVTVKNSEQTDAQKGFNRVVNIINNNYYSTDSNGNKYIAKILKPDSDTECFISITYDRSKNMIKLGGSFISKSGETIYSFIEIYYNNINRADVMIYWPNLSLSGTSSLTTYSYNSYVSLTYSITGSSSSGMSQDFANICGTDTRLTVALADDLLKDYGSSIKDLNFKSWS